MQVFNKVKISTIWALGYFQTPFSYFRKGSFFWLEQHFFLFFQFYFFYQRILILSKLCKNLGKSIGLQIPTHLIEKIGDLRNRFLQKSPKLVEILLKSIFSRALGKKVFLEKYTFQELQNKFLEIRPISTKVLHSYCGKITLA